MSYIVTIVDALFFSFAIASVPIGLLLAFYGVSPVGSFVLGMPLCWVYCRGELGDW